jgi:peptide/nickel transport system substrate-binding protein
MKTKLFSILAILLVLIPLAACGPTPAPQTIIQTVEVEKKVVETVQVEKEVVQTVEVEKTVEVVKEVEVTAVPEATKPTGTLVVAIATNPNTLDAPITAEMNASNAARPMFDSMLWINDQGEVEPALAESWEVSDDGLEYTFHLRHDVTFHDGEPFNADAVVFSWNRYKSPDLEWNERWNMADNVEKIDDYTVKVTTTEPKPLLLRTIAISWPMVPPKYFEQVGEAEFGQHPVGTGAFTFVEWVQGDHITMKANPNYWRKGYPRVENLIFRVIPESATRVAAIQTGEVDIVGRLSSEEAKALLGLQGVQVIRYPVTRVYYVAFNNMTTGLDQPTMDPRVRIAMNHAVDVQTILDSIFEGYAKRSTGFVATGEMGYGAVQPFEYNPDTARTLLAEAGYPNGFTMDMACPAGAYSHFEEVCEAIVGYLADVGITVNLEIMESGKYWDLEATKQLPPLFGDSWSESMGEAYNRMAGALLGPDAAYSSWDDPTIIDYLNKISTTVDTEARKKLYEDLQVYMVENPPFIYLYEPMAFEAVRDYVQDYRPRGNEEYHLWYTWVAKSQ